MSDKLVSPDYNWHVFPNFGYIMSSFTDADMAPIRQEIEEIKSDFSKAKPHQYSLAGQIKHEYELVKTHDYINKLVQPMVFGYEREFALFQNYAHLKETAKLQLEVAWVNFQQKTEYNPIHSHTGLLSFVIWSNIPYNMKDEESASPGSGANFRPYGDFQFHYINTLGLHGTHRLEIDKSAENTIVVFPSSFLHSVHPFYTTDDYRISVAGNITYKL